MEDDGWRAVKRLGTGSPRDAPSLQGPQPHREPAAPTSSKDFSRIAGPRAAPSPQGPWPRREAAAPTSQGPRPHRGAAPSSEWEDCAGWCSDTPSSATGSPSSPGRARWPVPTAAVPSLTDGDADSKKRRLIQGRRQGPVERGVERKQRGEWWKKVEIGVDFVPDSQGGSDDNLIFLPASDDSQIADGSVAVRADGGACVKGGDGSVDVRGDGEGEGSAKGRSIVERLRESFPPLPSLVDQYREIMNKYYGGIDRFHMLDDSRDIDDSQETMDEQLLLVDDAQAVEDDELLDDQLLVEDDSQAVDDNELLLVEDDSQAVDDNELLLVDDDSQPLTRSGSMFKSNKLAPAPSAPCAAPPSPDSTGAPSASCTGEELRSSNPGPGGVEGAPSPGGVQGPPSPCAAAGMASSSN